MNEVVSKDEGNVESTVIEAGRLRMDKKPRTVFVAYSYRDQKKDDYRSVFERVGKALDVTFVFADEKITNIHIVDKIARMIREAQFSIFDISGWNPNVTLELGLAWGFREKAYIVFDPHRTTSEDVPADLRGIDRLQYESYTEFESKLSKLMAEEFPPKIIADPLGELQKQSLELISITPGLKVTDIAKALGVATNLAKLIVGQLAENGKLETRGATRGTRYYLKGSAPQNVQSLVKSSVEGVLPGNPLFDER